MNVIRVEYEYHPLRAIYFFECEDEGQTDEQVVSVFRSIDPHRVIRSIQRLPNDIVSDNPPFRPVG